MVPAWNVYGPWFVFRTDNDADGLASRLSVEGGTGRNFRVRIGMPDFLWQDRHRKKG
jgi:hypothetical protein